MLSVVQNSAAALRRNSIGGVGAAVGKREARQDSIMSMAEAVASGYRSVPAGQEIYAEGEPSSDLYLVLEGWVFQHQILEDGRRQILDFVLPGALLGFHGEAAAEMAHTAEALTHATVAVIPRERLSELFARDPQYAVRIVAAAAGALNTAYESLTDVGRRTAREAVAHLLLRLFSRICGVGHQVAGTAIAFPLTQEHIGDALGLTAVHVCRTLRGLREEGVVQLSGGTLTVLNAHALAEIAGSAAEIIDFPGPQPLAARHPARRLQQAG